MADKIDLLNRENFIWNMIYIVHNLSENKKGCCFAIEGEWGTGKTFVIEEIENQLKATQSEKLADGKYFVFHYNCWKYDYYEEPSVAIISAMLTSIKEYKTMINPKFDKIAHASIEVACEKITEIAKTFVENKIGVDVIGVFEDTQKKATDNARKAYEFNDMFGFDQTIEKVRENLQEIAEEKTVVFVVDELDRCIPSYAIKVLERLHHIFYGIDNIIVIIAVDRKQLEHSVEEMFGIQNERQNRNNETIAEKYLKKFIDFSVELDNGAVNQHFAKKYESYYNQFHIADNDKEEEVNQILRGMFNGIDIRSQEKIVERANIIHSLAINNEKTDISVMLFEVIYEVLQSLGFTDMDCIATIEEDSSDLEFKAGEQRLNLLKQMETKSRYCKSLNFQDRYIYQESVSNVPEKKQISFTLCGKIFWYFANIFNKKDISYAENNSFNPNTEVAGFLKIAKRYYMFRQIIK